MEPTREVHATLVDLLDRIFDKGVVIQADIIISVAGIPLIGVNLRAALAGMETMLEYGLLKDWDVSSRAWETEARRCQVVPLEEDEEVVLKVFGSFYYSEGIYTAWRSGWLYLTSNRIFLYHQDFRELLFEARIEAIRALKVRTERNFTGKDRQILYLLLEGQRVARLAVLNTEELKGKIEEIMKMKNLSLEENSIIDEYEERATNFLRTGERVKCRGRMWHLVRDTSVLGDTWKPGHLYLTNERLCWWYEFERRVLFEVPVGEINASVEEIRDLSAVLKHKQVLDVIYSNNGSKIVASFSGKETLKWQAALNRAVAKQDSGAIEEKETCPHCGEEYLEETLLKDGCPACGWRSPLLKKEVAEVLKV